MPVRHAYRLTVSAVPVKQIFEPSVISPRVKCSDIFQKRAQKCCNDSGVITVQSSSGHLYYNKLFLNS